MTPAPPAHPSASRRPDAAAARILIVEDDPDVRLLLEELLTRAGHGVVAVGDGAAALRTLYAAQPDLVVLDLGLPEIDGWEVLQRVRQLSDVPLLVVTAQGAEGHVVRALREGADDYLVKPFGRQELVARVDVLLRRARAKAGAGEPTGVLDDGTVHLDPLTHDVRFAGRPFAPTPLELRLLTTLVRHTGQVLSTDQLLELCWDDTTGLGRDRVKVTIGYLRRKLVATGGWDPIETVRGFGYRYRPTAP